MSKVSENIRKYRNERGLKQSDLSKMIGKAPSVIANWEAGTNRPDVDSIAKMCEIFNIDANTFFSWESGKADNSWIAVDEDGNIIENLSDETLEALYKTLVELPPKALSEAKSYIEYLSSKYNAKE